MMRRSSFSLSLALGLALLAGPVGLAHAEIIDYNPEEQPVPEILPADDRALLSSFQGAVWTGLSAALSPDGRYGLANGPDGLMLRSLETGETRALPTRVEGLRQSDGYSTGIVATGWMAPHQLILLTAETMGEGDTATTTYYHLSIAADGLEVGLAKLPDFIERMNGSVSLSPDLRHVLVQRRKGGGTLSAARQVTLGHPDWSPRRPGLPAEIPGEVGANPLGSMALQQATTELAVVDLMGGAAPRALDLELPAESGIAGVSWSQDNSRIAVIVRSMPDWDGDRGRDNDPPGSGLPNLGSINVQEALGRIKIADNPLVQGSQILVAHPATGDTIARLMGKDYPQGMLAGLDFSPSGNQALLAITNRSDLEERPNPTYAFPSGVELHLLDKKLAPVRKIDAPGWDSLGAAVSFADENHLAAVLPAETSSEVQVLPLAGGPARTLWQPRGAIYQMLSAGGRLAMVFTSPGQAYELYTQTLDEAGPRQLTWDNAGLATPGLRYETVRWTSSKGQAMEGTYIHHAAQPFPPSRPGPVVVWQQGGPGGQMTLDWGTSVEGPYSVLPNFGIPVFMVNAVGRTVKSPQFFSDMAEGRNFGQLDIEQVKEGVDALVAQKVADPGRVGITGCSYGGYFTLQSLRAYPGFYAAANPQCSLTDLLEEFTMGYTPFISYLMGRAPMADPAEYLLDSPMYGSRDVKTPTLIFHGMEDFLPVPLINNIHDQLVQNGLDVRFLRVAGEGHGFGHPNSQAYAAQLQVAWFRKYLKVEPFKPHTVFLPNLAR